MQLVEYLAVSGSVHHFENIMSTIANARQAVADAAARAEFYRLWQLGQRAGSTHPHILEMMGPRTGSATTEQLRRGLLKGTRERKTITSIVESNEALVQAFEKAILISGEETGTLERGLVTLESHFKSEHKLLLKIWSKLTYPLILSLAFIVLAPLPLAFAGPAVTYVMSVVTGLALWYMLGGGIITALATRYASAPQFAFARLARALATGVEAGLPMDRVVNLAADAAAHPGISAHVRRQTIRQLSTQSISETFAGCEIIPVEMKAAFKVAEVSADFSGALRTLADLYDDRAS